MSPTTIPAAPLQPHATSSPGAGRPSRRRTPGKAIALVAAGVLVLGGAAYVTLDPGPAAGKVRSTLASLKHQVVGEHARPRANEASSPASTGASAPWDGRVKVSVAERDAIGFRILTVAPQTQPIHLELAGKTDYDQNTLNKIRPRSDKALVEKVYVSVGQSVKKGDPLYDLKSSELADAKFNCRTKYVQWDHDLKFLTTREPLVREGRITQKEWTDTQNDEKKSRLDYLNARELLGTYEITNDQINHLLEGLGDDRNKALKADDNTQDISRMTVLSKYDGIVVERDVVPGNLYDTNDVLLTISPMERLWVWGEVFESDQDKVHLDQRCTIAIHNEEYQGKVESIARGVDPETRTLRMRTSIPDPGASLFARTLAKVTLHIKPLPTDTMIPRNALVVTNGEFYAFVQQGTAGPDADRFARRRLEIEQEDHDIVIVKSGLQPGDRVVSNGSLILAQMYEDQSTVDSGVPSS